MLDNRIEIEAWLKEYKVIKYTITKDLSVDAGVGIKKKKL